MTSLAPLLLTLSSFAFAALEPLLGTESAGEKKGEEERERARLTVVVALLLLLLMAGTVVVIEADPWGRSDVSMEML